MFSKFFLVAFFWLISTASLVQARSSTDEHANDVPAWKLHPRMLVESSADVIENEFILVMRGATSSIRDRIEATGGQVLFEYKEIFQGLAIRDVNPDVVISMMETTNEDIVYSAPNKKVARATTTTQENPPWGLDRIDEKFLPLDRSYKYEADGSGVVVFVFDTGILSTHAEFGGRSSCAFNAIANEDCSDLHGHGTHVAGTIGGATFGVAKNVELRSVKVLDGDGFGSYAGILAGLDYVLAKKLATPAVPMIINMSLGGGRYTPLNEALDTCATNNILAVVAAGNERSDACEFSPASARSALTVGAIAQDDKLAEFTNQGTCVDLLAPGVDIPSASAASDYDIRTLSGTSMASPHVAGAAALYLERNPTRTPRQVTRALLERGISDEVDWLYPESGTPNLILRTKGLV